MKSDFHFDEELVRKISKEVAQEKIDEELTHHPELVQERDRLIKIKEQEAENEISQCILEVIEDLKVAGECLVEWFQRLPPEKNEALKKEFKRAAEIFPSEWFQKQLKEYLDNPTERGSPLQKLLKISDSTLQVVYEAGCHLQKEKDFIRGRAVFRFLAFINSNIPDFWICLGYCFTNLMNYSEAQASYRIAQNLDPKDPNSFYFSAVNYVMQHDYQNALDSCEKGITLINGEEHLQHWHQTIGELKTYILSKKEGGAS